MNKKKRAIILVNFGGPRSLPEIEPFLKALLTDQDVVRTKFPPFIHRFLFNRIAKKRAKKIAVDYASIGGKSPIFEDTEAVADCLRQSLEEPVITFHRYLPSTHQNFIKAIQKCSCDQFLIFPMFPQFTYATSGSIARWFDQHLSEETVAKMRWIKSYPEHPSFVKAHQNAIRAYFHKHQLEESDTVLLFSAHGIPKKFVATGDLYQDECEASFNAIMEGFPTVVGRLSYQSKFGPGEWLRPYTIDVCKEILSWNEKKKNIVFVPVSFTSDHIETLFEIETEYMTVIKEQGLNPYRVPALTLNPDWIQAILDIMKDEDRCNNQMLIRK